MAEVRYVVAKHLFRSKTFWVNALSFVVAAGAAIPGSPLGPLVAAHPGLAAGLAAAVGVANILLRIITDQPVHVLPE